MNLNPPASFSTLAPGAIMPPTSAAAAIETITNEQTNRQTTGARESPRQVLRKALNIAGFSKVADRTAI